MLIGGLFNLELFGGVNNLLEASPFIMAQAISGIPTLIIQLFMLYVTDKVNRFYRDGINGEEGYETEKFHVSEDLRQQSVKKKLTLNDEEDSILMTSAKHTNPRQSVSLERRLEDEGITSLFIEREAIL